MKNTKEFSTTFYCPLTFRNIPIHQRSLNVAKNDILPTSPHWNSDSFIKNNDKFIRMLIDFQVLNKFTIVDRFPLGNFTWIIKVTAHYAKIVILTRRFSGPESQGSGYANGK